MLANGDVLRTGGDTVKNVSGLDLTSLFVGSEGTLGVVVEIVVRAIPRPRTSEALAVCFSDADAGFDAMLELFAKGLQPAIVEFLDRATLDFLAEREGTHSPVGEVPPSADSLLLIQFDGSDAADSVAESREILTRRDGIELGKAGDGFPWKLLEVRKRTRGAESDTELRVGEDVTVPRDKLKHYVSGLRRIAAAHGVGLRVVAHAGDGNLHPLFWLDETQRARLPALESALDESIALALELRGTITGEHGIGQYKLRWFRNQHDEVSSRVHGAIKAALDPENLLNPGKAFLPPPHICD